MAIQKYANITFKNHLTALANRNNPIKNFKHKIIALLVFSITIDLKNQKKIRRQCQNEFKTSYNLML